MLSYLPAMQLMLHAGPGATGIIYHVPAAVVKCKSIKSGAGPGAARGAWDGRRPAAPADVQLSIGLDAPR
eukprot:COSAG03_NODE_1218_length_4536_cov_15.567275_2_plen_70_part_00